LINLPSQTNHQHIDTKSIVSGNDLKKDEINLTNNKAIERDKIVKKYIHDKIKEKLISKYDTPVKKNKTSKLELLNTASTASS